MIQADGPRARYRQQVKDEVQTLAWEQITEAGTSALSLKAIAGQLGMTAPALYRYYRSRDDLLTQLILSTYQDVAELIESAGDLATAPLDQLTEIARGLRRWAVANPQRYLLLYGTPVPGYHAPAEATEFAQRAFDPIVAGFAALPVHADIPGDLASNPGSPAFRRSVRFWTRLHGVLSLELAGHFVGMGIDTDELYDDEVQRLLAGDELSAH